MSIGCIIQASRYGWDGKEEHCLKKIDDKYVIEYVIEKIKKDTKINEIVIAAPETKDNDVFFKIAENYNIKCYLGSVDNVLERFIGASKEIESDIIVKILGQNCFLDTQLLNDMLECLDKKEDVDFLQMPDDFETKFTAEVFRKNLLQDIYEQIHKEDKEEIKKYLARPMSFVKVHKKRFNVEIYKKTPIYDKEYLIEIREKAKQIYRDEETGIDYKYQIEDGNFFLGRYKFAAKYLKNEDYILDIACGSAYGTKYIFDEISRNIIGADLSANVIQDSKKNYSDIEFQVQDATKTTFSNNQFDVILSMETFEHIPLELLEDYLKEMKRILKDGGFFICTTPQNDNGEIPIIPWHIKEYNLKEFRNILSKFFLVRKIYGSKNGIFSEDEIGNGMMAICEKNL